MAGIQRTRCIAPLAVVAVLLGWFGAAQAGGKTDKDKFQGDWIVQSAVKGGQDSGVLIKLVKAKFQGDKITLIIGDDKNEGIAKLDESKKPKTIDLVVENKTLLGIYQVDGETIKVCLNDPGQPRPTKFESPAGTEIMLVVFKRPPSADKEKKPQGKQTSNPGAFRGKQDKKELDKFQGTWTMVSGVQGGKDAPQDVLAKFKITFTGDKVAVDVGRGSEEGTFKIDPKTNPKSMDIFLQGKDALGIYQFDGDTLKICLQEGGNNRPKEFKSPAGTKTVYMVLKGAKPACDDEQPVGFVHVPVQGDKKDKSDKERFQGSWKIVEAEHDGKKVPQEFLDAVKISFTGDKMAMESMGKSKEGDFKLDPTTKPKSVDMNIDGKGIYQFDGEVLKICFTEGNDRPTKYEAGAGTNNILMVLKREKAAKKEEKKTGGVQFAPADCFVCCAVVSGDKGKDKSEKDLFQGPWKVLEVTKNGDKIPQEFLDGVKITFKGDKVLMEFMGTGKEGVFKLDPTTKPKSVELTLDDKLAKGIYQMEGDTLKICLKEGGVERPTKFEAAGSNSVLIVLKRDKVAKKEGKKTDGVQFTPADFAVCCADEGGDKGKEKSDKESFQGHWEVTSAEKGGEKIGADMLNQIKIKFAGDKLLIDLFGNKTEGAFKLDPTKNPKTIDVTMDDKTAQGIYELTADSLKIALAEPGQARPKDFNGTAGTENALVMLKRGKAPPPEKKQEAKTEPKEEVKNVPAKEVKGNPKGNKTDKEGLQGVWKLVALEVSGKKMDANELVGVRLIFVGEKLTAILSGLGELEEGIFKVDPSKEPRQLDLTLQGKTMKAIYKLEGDQLTVCGSEPGVGSGRPTAFRTADTKLGLLVLVRAKDERPDGFNANAQQSMNNLKQIVLAMHNYHSTYNKLPGAAIYSKAGKPLLSWRVAILPYVEQQQLYQQFKLDEPWDSDHNKKLIPLMPRLYTPYNNGDQRKSLTPYRIFTGPMTPFEGFGKDIKFQDFTDGTSNTVLVVEAADQVPWTKPEELPYSKLKDLPKLGGRPFVDRFHIAMADGSVRSVNVEFNATIFRAMITRNGGEVVNIDKLNEPKKSDK